MTATASKSKTVGLILGPVLFALVYFVLEPTALSYKGAVVLALGAWMVTWWVSEAAPIPVTALLPMILFPLFTVATAREAAAPYGDSIIFLFMGGFMIALGLEKHNLHTRIALNLIRLTGTSGNGIIMGFMLSTALISMWISNTATAVMMLPIATSVTKLLAGEISEADKPKFEKFATGLMLSIAYAASIGGIATIIGTPPNVVTVGFIKRFYDQDVSFATWMVIGVPLMLSILAACYITITQILYRNGLRSVEGSAELIQSKLKGLGAFSKEEKRVLIIFGFTCFFWIFRQNINALIGTNLLDDTTIAMTGGILMFITPIDIKSSTFILEWGDMKNLPWGILLLFGGGLSLAQAMADAGLVQLIGDQIAQQGNLSTGALIVTLSGLSMFLTELMSNVALTTIFVPVVLGIADGLQINPIILAMPVAFAASCAFMMPISTPPNAILFASGHISVKQMMRAGILVNLFSIILISIAMLTIGLWLYS
ncbi:MAG: SLC13/DASS family transporter [Cyclobacteriaceae bacterium]|nr:SLC13/DASS family transporter [Cyclobacteriaceae bacterium]